MKTSMDFIQFLEESALCWLLFVYANWSLTFGYDRNIIFIYIYIFILYK